MGTNEFEAVHEVRFGIVMYGGVSLAVYINGVAQELLSLVRATAPALAEDDPAGPDATHRLHIRPDELTPVERIYRELGQVMHGHGDDPAGQPVRTRFVVDIISGSSAGGINGVFLAKALANDQRIGALKGLWVEQAGFADILNDRTTRRGLGERLPDREPAEAMLSGDVMYLRLLDALDQMEGDHPSSGAVDGADKAPPSPYVRDLDLWITTTDLAGQNLPLRLADETISEMAHRQTFHFVFGESQATEGIRNDFVAGNNPILAFAARATSAFPAAFVPARLADIRRVIRQGPVGAGRNDPHDRRWRRWFGRYLDARPDFNYEDVSFGDGGDIDNKPFSWAIDTLSARTSSSLVDRRLLFVEPDPAVATVRTEAAPRPDVVASTIAAVSLGRVENIREDLERLARRTDQAERITTATDAIEAHYRSGAPSEAESLTTEEWLAESVDALRARGVGYRAYYDLRVEQMITEFSRSIARLPWHAAETDESAALRRLVARMVVDDYADPYVPDGPDAAHARPTTKEFLRDFDIAFRVRRLAFVAQRADALYSDPDERTFAWLAGLGIDLSQGESPAFRREIRRLKRAFSQAEENLRMWVPSVRSARDDLDPGRVLAGPAATSFILTGDEMTAIRRGRVDGVYGARAGELRQFVGGVGAVIRDVFEQSSAAVKAVLADPSAADATAPTTATTPAANAARAAVRTYYQRFADFDQVIFPLQAVAGTTGELDPVEVHRISPRDARSLVDPAHKPKVAGARLGHFGGFLDATWRANDIMWGRLDAAERLVTLLLADHEKETRERYRDRLHDAILLEEWYQPGRGGQGDLADPRATAPDPESVAWRRTRFRASYATPDWSRDDIVELGGRAAAIASDMSEVLADEPGSKPVQRALSVVASALSAISMLVLLRKPTARAVGVVVAVLGGALVAVGTLLNWDSASDTGWPLVGVGIAVFLLAFAFRLMVHRPGRLVTWPLLAVAVAAVVGLTIYGGVTLWHEHVSDWLP